MKTQIFIVLAALICAAEVCNSPFESPKSTTVDSVTISPSSGAKNFTMTVSYTYTWNLKVGNHAVHCEYFTHGGEAYAVEDIIPDGEGLRDGETVTRTRTIPFSIPPVNGKIQSGNYIVLCSTPDNQTMDSFGVTPEEQPAADVPPAPAAETETVRVPVTPTAAQLQLPAATETGAVPVTGSKEPLVGKIVFDWEKNTERGIAYAEHQSDTLREYLTFICSPSDGPEIMITSEGKIFNTTCKSGINPPLRVAESSFEYTVDGLVDESGNVTFTYQVKQSGLDADGKPQGVWQVQLKGQGKFNPPSQASGMATFTYKCDDDTAYSDVSNLCGTSENVLGHYTFSGQLPWHFEPVQ